MHPFSDSCTTSFFFLFSTLLI